MNRRFWETVTRAVRDSSGMALLLTVAAVSFLVALTVQLTTSVNWQIQASTGYRDEVRLNSALLSGLDLFRAALYADQEDREKDGGKKDTSDSLLEDWASLDMELIDPLVGGHGLIITARDMSGRIQINRLWISDKEKNEIRSRWNEEQQKKPEGKREQNPPDPEKVQRDLWKRLLLSGKFAVEDNDEATALIDALTDWLDTDDDERDHGAEEGYYRSLDPPYAPRNGPMQYAEELLLVKGFSRKLVYGDGDREGILPYVTVYGNDGKININTAPAPVLQAMAENMNQEAAALLVEYRRQQENKEALQSPDWYRKVPDFPGDIVFPKDLVTLSSSFFSCEIRAGRNGLQLTGKGFIYRNPETREQTLLSWQVE